MKFLTFIFLAFSFSFSYGEEVPPCSLFYLSKAKKKVENHTQNTKFKDKFKHCAISCLLARRCPDFDVMQLGVIKELVDIVGPGNAEWADLEADYKGVDLGKDLRGANDKVCLGSCATLYPENAPSSLNCRD